MASFSETLQSVADEFTRICYKAKVCEQCPFFVKGRECSASKMDDLVRQAKQLEERSKTLLEGAQALQNVMNVK